VAKLEQMELWVKKWEESKKLELSVEELEQ
jgi:hypothetical protein